MNKRLQTLLEIEHLSPSQLADTLGIQRGGISHLLSGRNKPSFDFLQKVLYKFPDINAEWLITGNGKPVKGYIEENNKSLNTDKVVQKTDFQNNNEETNLFNQSVSTSSDITDAPLSAENSAIRPESSVRTAGDIPAAGCKENPQRTVRRIIIYYSDGTYNDFYPGSN